MFSRLRGWLAKNRRWNEDHRRAWAGVTESGADGLAPFQRETEAAIRAFLHDRELELRSRELIRTEGDDENYIVAEVPELAAKIWIYRDQTDVQNPTAELRLEEWDARTPEEHRQKVVAFLSSLELAKL